ncbi:MAG: helix-turn-helix domain-containing protein [Acidimicrobiales bacterium]
MASLDASARQGIEQLGEFIRAQRHLAELSLRELAARANVSNPYLSQVERGLHEPSVRVLHAIATALNVSAESLLAQAGLLGAEARTATTDHAATEAAIAADPILDDEQRAALLAVYRSYVAQNAKTNAAKPRKRTPRATKPRA